jgi:hypothetical protein
MYIRALLDLVGTTDSQNHGLMSYSTLIWPAQSIFEYLEEIEDVLEDFGWQLVGLEEIEFGVEQQRFLEQEFIFYTFSEN